SPSASSPPSLHDALPISFVAQDLWSVARARMGFLALVLCFLPLGSGAATGLWSAVAGDWHATADTVALVTGLASGLISAAGCIRSEEHTSELQSRFDLVC